MFTKDSKIIIVGAGPIGCYTAQLLKHHGFDPLVIEEHAEVGRPVQCAGIVGKGIFEEMVLPISRDSIVNTINGGRVSFNGDSFELRRKNVAYIIDREVFDKKLAQGLRIDFSTKFLSLEKNKNKGYMVKTGNGEYYADLVIGADGPSSKVRSGWKFDSEMKLYRGYQYRIKVNPKDKDTVEVYYLKPFSFFVWLIPEGNGICRVGIISDHPYKDLNRFLEIRGIDNAEIIEKNAGLIPIGTCQMAKENVALVGDAACQLKPITSGGIYYGMKSAEILAEAVKNNDLSSYETRWKDKFEQEVRFCLTVRSITENMDKNTLKKVFQYLKENVPIIEKIGDFENHSSVVWSLMSNPLTYSTIGAVMWNFIKSPQAFLRLLSRR